MPKSHKSCRQPGLWKSLGRCFSLALAASLATAPSLTPAAVAQSSGQANQPAYSGGANQATNINGLPKNLTEQQIYLRNVFIFKKLKLIDELIKQDHHVQARQILEELATLDPNPYSADVHGLLAESCYRLGNNPETIKNYQLAIQFSKDKDVGAYWNIALAYMNMSDYDNATIWCKRLLTKNPSANLRRQAERFLNDVGEQKTEQQESSQQSGLGAGTGSGADNGGDYLNHLNSTREANRWPREKLPIKVFIEDDRKVPGFRPEFVTIFLNCLEVWTKATRNRLSFQLVQELSQADLNVVFTANVEDIARKPGMAPAEQGLASIKAYGHPGAYGSIESAKIWLLVHNPTNKQVLTNDDMKGVCLHEIGHALGLSGHSPNDSDIMHFLMSFRQLPALTKRDKQTIARLYQDYPSTNETASANYQPSSMAATGQYQPQYTPQQMPPQPQFQQQLEQQPVYQPQPQYQPQQQGEFPTLQELFKQNTK